jgi:competence ComEA-like helix-hairpin-helix protein
MRLHSWLQERFGFTRNEIVVILVLSLTFCAGNAIQLYRSIQSTVPSIPQPDYSQSDSEFIARSRSLLLPVPSVPRNPSGKKSTLAARSIDLNTATLDQLMSLPGVGRSTAEKILQYRSEHGPFTDPAELTNVQGIGPKKLEKIEPLVRTD